MNPVAKLFVLLNKIFPQNDRSTGRLRGFILRSQLIVIMKNSFYEENERTWIDEVSIEDFRNEYPRYPSIDVSTLLSGSSSECFGLK